MEKYAGFDVKYHDFGEREVRAVTLYANASKLYVDAEHTVEATSEDVLDLCEKGFLRVFDTDTFYAVTSFKESDGTVTVGYNSTTATVSPALAAAASVEPEAEPGFEA